MRDAEGARLENGTNGHDYSADKDRLLTTDGLSDVEGRDSTKEATDSVDRCDDRQDARVLRPVKVVDIEVIF